ncbi:MAG TPA: hypothetical protein VMU83_23955 [Hanamia sp.]|nr:hypothetical protein [Hanamia sp.]
MIHALKISLFFLMLFACSKGFSQIFSGNPPSLKWKQINTPDSRVIFPADLDSVATRITNIISYIKVPTERTIGTRSKKINIVLQNQTTVSNAYVALGPFRSEFYLTPDQNSFEMGSLPWPDQLTIHEYRHVEQFNNFDAGLSKVMRILFGEEGQALANNAAIPNWFYEGDAVFNETNLSRQGRGRLPFFFDPYRSLWKAGKNYSWMKMRNGSLKDFVPDHYALGYLLVSYGREKYGDKFWEKVIGDAAAYKSLFYPFQHAIKKYSGVDFLTFRNEGIDFFKKEFNSPPPGEPSEEGEGLGAFRDEQYPSFTENGSLIYEKDTYKKIPKFVIRKGNKEYKIRTQDYTLDSYFSYKNEKIVYSSYRPDIRWGYRDYSDLQILDVTNGHQYTLTKRNKYFSPDISSDGREIVAVHEFTSGKCELELLNSKTGKIIYVLPNPDKLFYTYPKFFDSHKIISAVRNSEGKMSLQEIDLANDRTEYLLPFTYNVIGFPCFSHDTLYFSYAYKKNDELFAYTFRDKKIWLIETKNEQGLGKYHATVSNSKIVWSSFTAEGYRLQQFSKQSLKFVEINKEDLQKGTSDFGITVLNNTNSDLLYSVPNETFAIKKYRKTFDLFNFHSIEPAVNDPQYTLSLVSENILNTLQSNVSFTYDRAEKYKEVSFDAIYGAWFPYLSAGVNYLIDRNSLFHQNLIHYNQFEPYAGFNIPLDFSKGRSFTYLNFGSQYVYSSATFRGTYKDTLGTPSYSYSSNFLSFSHEIQMAQQQIFPSFAQTVSLAYKTPLTKYRGFQYLATGNLYFPGFSKKHSVVLNGAYLHQDSLNKISFSSEFPFSRGYQAVNFYKMYKWGINYNLPLALPDWGFADILYFLRVRANLFYDDTEVKDFFSNNTPYSASFRSTGTEIYFDTKWWNEVNVSFGVRYSRLLNKDLYGGTGYNRWEIILPVNILNQ